MNKFLPIYLKNPDEVGAFFYIGKYKSEKLFSQGIFRSTLGAAG